MQKKTLLTENKKKKRNIRQCTNVFPNIYERHSKCAVVLYLKRNSGEKKRVQSSSKR